MIDAAAPENLARLAALQRRLRTAAVPAAGSIEPTRRCNLRCAHCYVGAERFSPDAGAGELDTAAWLALIDDVAAAGCLELCCTGGEPLLRADFPALYERARRAGIAVTLFTNGTLVDAATAALLRESAAGRGRGQRLRRDGGDARRGDRRPRVLRRRPRRPRPARALRRPPRRQDRAHEREPRRVRTDAGNRR